MTEKAQASSGAMNGRQILACLTVIALCIIGMWQMVKWMDRSNADFTEYLETVVRVSGIRSYQKSCPAIASRLNEYLADGRVTEVEHEVVKTIIAQQRALPGGIEACK